MRLGSPASRRVSQPRLARRGVSANYTRLLDPVLGVFVHIEFKTVRRDIVDYAVVLLVDVDGGLKTVRFVRRRPQCELHRYTRDCGKQPAEIVHRGTLGQGMRAAIDEIERGYRAMVEAWQDQ
jgi:hypothetical protein